MKLKRSEKDLDTKIPKPFFVTSTNYRYLEKVIPELDKTNETEQSGYITTKQRIENMMLAGQRLQQARKEMYDFHNTEIDEDFTDPTRSKNFDLADATTLGMETEERLRAQKEEKEKVDLELKKEAEEKAKKDKEQFKKWKKRKKSISAEVEIDKDTHDEVFED